MMSGIGRAPIENRRGSSLQPGELPGSGVLRARCPLASKMLHHDWKKELGAATFYFERMNQYSEVYVGRLSRGSCLMSTCSCDFPSR
jgi:hypothetical protein